MKKIKFTRNEVVLLLMAFSKLEGVMFGDKEHNMSAILEDFDDDPIELLTGKLIGDKKEDDPF